MEDLEGSQLYILLQPGDFPAYLPWNNSAKTVMSFILATSIQNIFNIFSMVKIIINSFSVKH